ncbi:MAG: LptE family protein [Chlorobiaceae bacterium]|nr:LptE family protein [Chlorobiaceae bacterium]
MRKAAAFGVLFYSLVAVFLQGCYSFSGTSIPPHLKTIAIPVIDDRSGAGIAQFRAELTRGVVNKIESQSPLRFTPSMASADANLEGTIISFSDMPSQLSSKTERALTNRITLIVQVTMTDRVKKKPMFSQSFVGFADYYAGNYAAEQEAIRSCEVQIIDDIFNRVVSGW